MSRPALARQYRPRRFGEIAMQEHVSTTLRAAVARGRVAHAYLFCGPRGVGKTTAARVLAMALNCPERSDEGEPCGECDSCDRIWSGRTSLDVVEIDAASNRGVDDARELRERAMYAPTDERRYKVYILDEAHMLTREAWNALLKILEEPPPRVIFVFATTEPQKIQQAAPPILSRCQRFDFHRVGVSGIIARLREVLEREGVDADEDALIPLARRAEGGLRDALSLLDQVLSFTEGRLTTADVRQVLGLVGEELYLELFEILADRRHADVFRLVDRVLDEGYDLSEFYRGLADAIRLLLLVRFEGDDAAGVREDLRAEFSATAQRFGTGDLLRMLSQVAELDADGRFRKSSQPRLLLEAVLLRFSHLDRTIDLEKVILGSVSPAEPSDARAHQVAATAARSEPPARGGSRTAAPDSGASMQAGQARVPAGTDPVDGPVAAYQAAVREGAGLPRFVTAVLRAGAEPLEVADDRLVLAVPPGVALQRLTEDPAARTGLEEAVARQLGRPIRLEFREHGAPAPRMTSERLQEERLDRLARDMPVLGRAIEAWDLEITD